MSNGAGVWKPVANDNTFSTDDVFFEENPSPWSEGEITWFIPCEWTTARSNLTVGVGTRFCNPIQRFTLMTDGTASIGKFGHVVTRNTNDVIFLDGRIVQ